MANLKLIIPLSSIVALVLVSGIVIIWPRITRRKRILYLVHPYSTGSSGNALVKGGIREMKPREGRVALRMGEKLMNDTTPVCQPGNTTDTHTERSQQQLLITMLQRLTAVEEAVQLSNQVSPTMCQAPVTMNNYEDQLLDYSLLVGGLSSKLSNWVLPKDPAYPGVNLGYLSWHPRSTFLTNHPIFITLL